MGGLFGGGSSSSSSSSSSTNVTVNTEVNPNIVIDTQGVKDSVQNLVDTLSGIAKVETETQAERFKAETELSVAKIIADVQNAETIKKATIAAAVIGALALYFRR